MFFQRRGERKQPSVRSFKAWAAGLLRPNPISVANPAAGVPATPFDLTGLQAHWRLADVTDASGNGNTLTNNGTTTFGVGKIDNAAYFDGATQYLSIADNAALSVADVDFTVVAWLYLTDKSAVRGAVCKGDTALGNQIEYGLYYDSGSDRLRFRASDGNFNTLDVVSANTFGAVPLNTWMFAVGWNDSAADTINIQINNGAVDSAAHVGGSNDGTHAFEIGRQFNNFGSLWWAGRIDAVEFWKRKLTAAERTTKYGGGAGDDYPY
jgi:hypothetical protein